VGTSWASRTTPRARSPAVGRDERDAQPEAGARGRRPRPHRLEPHGFGPRGHLPFRGSDRRQWSRSRRPAASLDRDPRRRPPSRPRRTTFADHGLVVPGTCPVQGIELRLAQAPRRHPGGERAAGRSSPPAAAPPGAAPASTRWRRRSSTAPVRHWGP
jgi:hypothetical protein